MQLLVVRHGIDRVTAIVAWSDPIAERICAKLSDLGVSIPNDVAVVSFDGFQPLISPKYRLTSVRAPWEDVGAKAVESVSALMDRRSMASILVLPVELIRGDTT